MKGTSRLSRSPRTLSQWWGLLPSGGSWMQSSYSTWSVRQPWESPEPDATTSRQSMSIDLHWRMDQLSPETYEPAKITQWNTASSRFDPRSSGEIERMEYEWIESIKCCLNLILMLCLNNLWKVISLNYFHYSFQSSSSPCQDSAFVRNLSTSSVFTLFCPPALLASAVLWTPQSLSCESPCSDYNRSISSIIILW